ncbi:MAG: hypothetical protein IKC03_10740 [Oscillospiraceae bacterium]|nr:hypothetical protein [Oscillospiraceae bacterium]
MTKALSFMIQFAIVALIALILSVVVIVSLVLNATKSSHPEYVQKLSGLDISDSTIVSVEDTHGGLHGDGDLIVKFDCTEIADSVIEQMASWRTLPMTEPLQNFMYGGDRFVGIADRMSIPKVTNGYYFFWDRHSESTDPTSDRELLDRHSFNFTLILYDADHSQLYLLELDT